MGVQEEGAEFGVAVLPQLDEFTVVPGGFFGVARRFVQLGQLQAPGRRLGNLPEKFPDP